jgi:adenosylcobinamide-phosphate synthase
VLGCALAGVVGGSPRDAWRIMRRDAHDHPSPNGGWCESAWAGALGVQLGGRNVYPGGRVEERGLLGDGPRPGAREARRASDLVGAVTGVAAVLAVASLAVARVVGRQSANGKGRS